MHKKYILFSISLFCSFLIFGQTINVVQNSIKNTNHLYSNNNKVINDKSATCIDSIRYPQSKLTGSPEAGALTNNANAQTGISQAYHFVGNGLIHGIGIYALLDFDGIPGNMSPIAAKIKVYNIDGQNYPTTPIDSATIQVVDVGFQEQVLMFTSPITVTDSFAITLEMDSVLNTATDTIWYTTNVCAWNGSVCTVGDGNGENLSCVLSPAFNSANGSHWFNNNIEVFGWNIDMLMHPIFQQTINASYVSDLDSVCLGQAVKFTNTSSVDYNSMFNPQPTKYFLDLGDGSSWNLDTNYRYTYLNSGVYNTSLTVTNYGYSNDCLDSTFLNITVLDTAIANFSNLYMGLGAYQFTDSSTNAVTWLWDFGDGSSTSTTQNPTHTYTTAGSYQVCLTASDTNGCNTNMFCDSVSFVVGINDINFEEKVKIYPIPAKKYLNIDVPKKYIGGKISISNIVGEELKTLTAEANTQNQILVNDIPNGIYFVSIEVNNEKVFTKRIIVNH